MGVWDWFRGRVDAAAIGPVHDRDASDDRWFSTRTESYIGVPVTVNLARQIPVVRDCLQTLSGAIAGLRFGVFRGDHEPGGRTDRLSDHPIAALLARPNERQTSFEFISQIVDDLAAWGNFVAVPEYVGGRVVSLKPLVASRLTIEELPDGSKRFLYARKGEQVRYVEDEVWHIPLPPTIDGIRGRSPILDDGIEAVAVAIALQRYANTLFVNDATPPYWLSTDSHFAKKEDRDGFLAALRRHQTGRNRHTPGILEHGFKPISVGIKPEEAQFLETRNALWLDLTRLWRMPPHKVGIMDRATFSNIEHQSLEFVTDTLRPLIELIERSITRFLIDEPGVFFEFSVDSLLRGDIERRYSAYAHGRQWGWLSVNDIRRAENMNEIGPAGDRYVEPMNMTPAGSAPGDRAKETANAETLRVLRETIRPIRPSRQPVKETRDAA